MNIKKIFYTGDVVNNKSIDTLMTVEYMKKYKNPERIEYGCVWFEGTTLYRNQFNSTNLEFVRS